MSNPLTDTNPEGRGLFNVGSGGMQQVFSAPPPEEFVAIEVEEANTLGQRHYLAGDFPRAEECFIAVVKADPNHAYGWGNLGLIWMHTGHMDDALKCFMRSFDLMPDNPQNITNMGYLHDTIGMHDHAVRFYERALELDSVNPRATCNLGHNLLRRFEFARGWPMMEARFHTVPKISVMREYPMPLWDGKPCKKLAIWREQGIGDQIVFGTLLNDLVLLEQEFVCELDERLLPAFRRSFPHSEFVPQGHGSGFDGCDAHIPMMSLGRYLRPSLGSFSAQPAKLLMADATRSAMMDFLIDPSGKKRKIAIAWRSFHPAINISAQTRKSATLDIFAPIAAMPNTRLVSVQYGDVKADIEACSDTVPLYVPTIDLFKDIDGVLATIAACDIVVTTSNVTAHFAGALGKPTCLIMQRQPTFYYWVPLDNMSLWYPSVRCVIEDTWEEAIAKVKELIE